MGEEKQMGRNAKRKIKNYELINNERSAMFQALGISFRVCSFLKAIFPVIFVIK